MAITTMAGLVAALASGQYADTLELTVASQVAGAYGSLWTATGRPGAGATPASGAGAAPTSATAGAIPFTNPSGSNTMYLGKFAAGMGTVGTIILLDRLVHTSGLSGTSTSAQTVNSTAITRTYNSNLNVGCWLEWYTATGSTATTATVSYTNQAGSSGKTGTATLPASTAAARAIPVALAAGDTGVQSVQSVTLAASTLTAGNFGITLAQRLASISVLVAGGNAVLDYAGCGLAQILSNACLSFYVLCSTTSTGTIETELSLIQG